MKRIIVLLILAVSFSGAFAQKGKVTSAQNYKNSGKLDKAHKAIELTIDKANPKSSKTILWPKTWEVRGEVYQAIGTSKEEKFKALSNDALSVALESYKKALELDKKGRIAKSVKIKLTLLTNDLTNQAVEQFGKDDYAGALKSFEQIIDLQNIPVVKADNPDAIDTAIYFNAGLAAYNAKNYKKATEYYGKAAHYGYGGARTYSLLSESYKQMKDTVSALKAVQEGFEKYPENTEVLNTMIDIYLRQNAPKEAMKYLNVAIEKDPTNSVYYHAQGTLFERFGEEENAIKAYEKAIDIDNASFNAYYNLGVLYYNRGVKQYEIARDVPPNENAKYEAELKKADVWFEKSLPYMEKCHELQPKENVVLESLKNLYYRIKDMDKYNAILEKLGQ